MELRPDPAENLRLALELSDAAEGIKLMSLYRQYPGERDDQIRVRLENWLLKRGDDGPWQPGSKRAA